MFHSNSHLYSSYSVISLLFTIYILYILYQSIDSLLKNVFRFNLANADGDYIAATHSNRIVLVCPLSETE